MDATVCVWNLELWILAVSELTLDLHTSIERVFLKLLYYKFINFIFFKTEYQNKKKTWSVCMTVVYVSVHYFIWKAEWLWERERFSFRPSIDWFTPKCLKQSELVHTGTSSPELNVSIMCVVGTYVLEPLPFASKCVHEQEVVLEAKQGLELRDSNTGCKYLDPWAKIHAKSFLPLPFLSNLPVDLPG